MRREKIAEYKQPRNDAFASVVRSFGEANSRFQALAVESVGRAVEIQSQFFGKAYDTYISEISKLGRMFIGYRAFTDRPQDLPHDRPQDANLDVKKSADRQQPASAEAKVNLKHTRQRTAALGITTKRKTGTVAKSQSSSKRSTKAKRKAGSVHRKG